jgi:hypothetical protein
MVMVSIHLLHDGTIPFFSEERDGSGDSASDIRGVAIIERKRYNHIRIILIKVGD